MTEINKDQPQELPSSDLPGEIKPGAPISTMLLCTQCGGELHPDEGQSMITCPFCAATVYVDKTRVVFHWYVAPTLDENQAQAALFRWMSGSQTVKDLDKKARLTGHTFQYFPLWFFRNQQTGKSEEIVLQPAAATSVTELTHLRVPAGDLRRYEPELDSQAVPPSVPLETGLEWLQRNQPGGTLNVQETALVHIPVHIYKYEYRGQGFTAIVEAASGSVLANIFPAKAETPYLTIGGVTALVYLCLAMVPVVGAFSQDFTVSLAVCGGLGLLAAPILFAWAFWVASKV